MYSLYPGGPAAALVFDRRRNSQIPVTPAGTGSREGCAGKSHPHPGPERIVMATQSYLKRFRGWFSSRQPRRPHVQTARIGLEGLEERLAPASNLVASSLTAPALVVP